MIKKISVTTSSYIFTAPIRRMTGGYVCFWRGGGYPIWLTGVPHPSRWVVPPSFPMGGTPILPDEWVPPSFQMGGTHPSWWGYPLPRSGEGAYPLSRSGQGTPFLSRSGLGGGYTPHWDWDLMGYPLSELDRGSPHQDWIGYPPNQDWMEYPPPPIRTALDWTGTSCVHAGGLSCSFIYSLQLEPSVCMIFLIEPLSWSACMFNRMFNLFVLLVGRFLPKWYWG